MKRETFLQRLTVGLSGLIGSVIAIPVIGSLIAPFFKQAPAKWRTVGKINQFKVGDTTFVKFENASSLPWSGTTQKTAAWLRRKSEKEFTAFSINCTHLGCPVRWKSDAELFMCPCHGGIYYKDGSQAAGPPPKALPRYPVRLKRGHVQIQTTAVPITNITD